MDGDITTQRWFEKYPGLFQKQRDILKSAGFEMDEEVLTAHGYIQFSGFSKADPTRRLYVRFPEAFPSAPPQIFDTPSSKLLRRHHRIDSRQLCLFSFNNARWSAGMSVAEALVEAEELIAKYKDGPNSIEDEPPEPLSQAIAYQPAAILVPPPISTYDRFVELKSSTGSFRMKFVFGNDQKNETSGRGMVIEAAFGANKLTAGSPYVDYFKSAGKEMHGDWYYLKEPPTQENLTSVLDTCFNLSKGSRKAEFYWLALIYKEENGRAIDSRLTWLIARGCIRDPGKYHIVRTFPYVQQERYVRIPGLEGLEQKRVMIVGCGSLGSKIAANLAASGVNHFQLVDYDFYEPHNSVRHELGVEFFGMPKAYALLQRLASSNPAAAQNSQFLNFQVGGINPFTAESTFRQLAKDSDLIIDAGGAHCVNHYLSQLSFELRVPLVMSWVSNGAWSGEVVRIFPGKTPCFSCWLDAFYDNKPPSAPKPTAGLFAPGCNQPTFTGTTYDLGIVAGLATAMCVETLLPQLEHVNLTVNYLRWHGRDAKGAPIFSTERLATTANPECWCRQPIA